MAPKRHVNKRATIRQEREVIVEFLLVTLVEDRTVLADGDMVGVTNHILMLPANEYTISLQGGGTDPVSQDVVLAGTSAVRPKVVHFAKG